MLILVVALPSLLLRKELKCESGFWLFLKDAVANRQVCCCSACVCFAAWRWGRKEESRHAPCVSAHASTTPWESEKSDDPPQDKIPKRALLLHCEEETRKAQRFSCLGRICSLRERGPTKFLLQRPTPKRRLLYSSFLRTANNQLHPRQTGTERGKLKQKTSRANCLSPFSPTLRRRRSPSKAPLLHARARRETLAS